MASDEEEEECGYFYDDDDAEEDAAAGLEQAAAPPPERRADYWVSGVYRSSPASTNARSPRRRDRGGARRSGSAALHLRTAPIRQILFLAHRKGKVKREKSGGNSAQAVCVTPNLRGSSRIVRRFRGIWLKSAQMSKILTGSAWVGMVLLGGMYARGFVISVR